MKAAFLSLLIFCSTLLPAQSTDTALERLLSYKGTTAQMLAAYIAYNNKHGVQNFDAMQQRSLTALQWARQLADSTAVGVLLRQWGDALYFKGQYNLAAERFYNSIAVLEKAAAKAPLAESYNSLAKLYRKTRDLSRSLENYDKAFTIFKQLSDSVGMATIWNESGVVFEYNKQYDKALARYTASLQLNQLLHDNQGIGYALNNIAGLYVLEQKYGLAQQTLAQALGIRRLMRDTFAMALTYSDMATAYAEGKEYGAARVYYDSSNTLAAKMAYPELLKSNYASLAVMAEKEGDYKAAYNYKNRSTALQDSLFNIEKVKQIEELNSRYQTVQKEKTIADQQHRLQEQNTLFIGGGAMAVLAGLLGFTQYRRYKWKQEARLQTTILQKQEEATKAILEAEEAERQRIAKDLHDGVGQMMSAAKMNLSAYEDAARFATAEERSSFEKIIQLVDESCTEVRSVSHNMMPNALVKNNLDAAIREFISKLDERKLKVHLYTKGLDERLATNVETVLYRVIQECVNNVMKHAGATQLDITIIAESGELTATVEDNGKGFDTGDTITEGVGLKNIRTRLAYLKGTVDFDSKPGRGTLVALHVPL